MLHQRGWCWSTTSGYNPKANGAAENGVRLVKDLTRRALQHASMEDVFGTQVVIRRLEPASESHTWKPRGSMGRLVKYQPMSSRSAVVWIEEEDLFVNGLSPQ
eukprot:35136-Amphidinium_carterae.1